MKLKKAPRSKIVNWREIMKSIISEYFRLGRPPKREVISSSCWVLTSFALIWISLSVLHFSVDWKYVALLTICQMIMDNYGTIKPTFDSPYRVSPDLIYVTALFVLNPLGILIMVFFSTFVNGFVRKISIADMFFNFNTLNISVWCMAYAFSAPLSNFNYLSIVYAVGALVVMNIVTSITFVAYGEYAEAKAIMWSKPEFLIKLCSFVFGVPIGYCLQNNWWMASFILAVFGLLIFLYKKYEVLHAEKGNLQSLADTLDSTSNLTSLEEVEKKLLEMARRYLNLDSVELVNKKPKDDELFVLFYDYQGTKKWLFVDKNLTGNVGSREKAFKRNLLNIASLSKRAIENFVLKEQLRQAAQLDGLTGLHNRRSLEEVLDREMAAVRRGNNNIAVLFIDLDGFKPINDEYGHAQGDYVLKVTASRINETVREEDFVARIGGDEFVVVCRNQNEEAVNTLKDRLCNAVSKSIAIKNNAKESIDINVSASVGLSYSSETLTTTDEIINFADKAMYTAKKKSKKLRINN